jgi:hypothetical protein
MRKITLIFLLLFIVGCGSNISFAKKRRHKVWKPKKTRLLDRRYERCPQMGL